MGGMRRNVFIHCPTLLVQVKIKVEKPDEDKEQELEANPDNEGGLAEKLKLKEVEEEEKKSQKANPDPEIGRLVMTIDGQQKQLSFGPKDLLTMATMLDGDKVSCGIKSCLFSSLNVDLMSLLFLLNSKS